ncbi:unnamed protein product [Chrysodeixis includens]|uniref:Ketoreductase domain-containing protein n=1 Tax=Chrysodeixis includens TaxID=689277 RepID=A0A9N8L2F0_CHRIL|nr:unnamed protein product [Chrysodeixis includens]
MFANKVVLITGASSGIGADTAIEFAKLDAKLVVTGRNKDNLEKTAKECELQSPSKLTPLSVVGDVDKEADIERLIKETIDHFGQLDVLVNNAGIMGMGSIENTSLEQYDSIMNTNVRGPYYLTMLATPHLVKSKGNIVNVSSIAGLRSFPGVLAYCTSKAAMDQFTRCVALELAGKGVRVNAVNPGVIATNIRLRVGVSEADYAAYLEKCKETHALGRTGTTLEVANTIIFLASDAASNITGISIPVDGGRHAMCPR